jgi:hypothetical protein
MPLPAIADIENASLCQERLWDELCSCPSIFGRLVAISKHWNESTRTYTYPLCGDFSVALIDRTLKQMHWEVFEAWQNLNLRQQHRDLTIFVGLSGFAPGEGAQILQTRIKSLTALVPPQHIEPQRDCFLSDLQALIPLFGGAETDAAQVTGRRFCESLLKTYASLASRVQRSLSGQTTPALPN